MKKEKRTIEGWAKEDARYVVSLATKSQFGMSINARALENMLRQFSSSNLDEIKELGKSLFSLVKELSPSIIKYTEPTDYDVKNKEELNNLILNDLPKPTENKEVPEVKLIDEAVSPDELLCAVIYADIYNCSIGDSIKVIETLSLDDKTKIIKHALKYRELYDSVSRYFEQVDYTFEFIISSSNYGQLKRHRMASMLPQKYDVNLGVTIPENIKIIGMEKEFLDIVEKTDDFYNKIKNEIPNSADYILTNAHRRRVIIKMNMREIYHFVSLRVDAHAQWDIRETALKVKEIMQEVAPLSSMMLAGKSEYKETYEKVFEN